MMNCSNCGSEIGAQAKVCGECGEKVSADCKVTAEDFRATEAAHMKSEFRMFLLMVLVTMSVMGLSLLTLGAF